MTSADRRPRLMGVLLGDVYADPGARVKYGLFFQELARRYPLVVHDARLRGLNRWMNALVAFHPNKTQWRERFYQNGWAFRRRSIKLAAYLRSRMGQFDVILQVGGLFDAGWGNLGIPQLIYTDYTASLAAKRPDAGRSPFSAGQRARWLALERAMYQQAAHICTRSQAVRRAMIADYGLPTEKVTAIGGGVNFSSLPELGNAPTREQPIILFIGKDFYRKGGDVLLRAFGQVRERIPQAHLWLMTEGPAPKAEGQPGVRIIDPTWNRQVIHQLYSQASLFVLPSRLETWGDVLLEAMAYQLPCIGVQADAMEEIILNGITGLVVPPDDFQALEGAIVRLLSEPSIRCTMGKAGRRRVEQNFLWARVIDRLEPIIQQIFKSESQ